MLPAFRVCHVAYSHDLHTAEIKSGLSFHKSRKVAMFINGVSAFCNHDYNRPRPSHALPLVGRYFTNSSQ